MNWLDAVCATDTALLPTLVVQQVWLHLGWSVVLAWLVLVVAQRVGSTARSSTHLSAIVALAVGLWAWVPGTASPAYWLGLAFQAPSIVAVLLCAGAVVRRLHPGVAHKLALDDGAWRTGDVMALCVLGVLAGWALLLDSFALLPLQLYAWGFSPLAVGVIALAALLPATLLAPRGTGWVGRVALVPAALLLLVAAHLPTGNAWDAVLDPWLWLVLQFHVGRLLWKNYKNIS